jgi:hypothetical protein
LTFEGWQLELLWLELRQGSFELSQEIVALRFLEA